MATMATIPFTSSVVTVGGQVIIRLAKQASGVTSPETSSLLAYTHAPVAAQTPVPTPQEETSEEVWIALEDMLRKREAVMRMHPSWKA